MHAHRATLGLAIGAAVALAGCGAGRGGPEPPPNDRPGRGGGVSVVGVVGTPSLDPHRVRTGLDAMVHRAMYRQLYVRVPGRAAPVPDLAAGPAQVSDDGLTVTVVLRRRVRFSGTGDPIRAVDVKRGIERAVRDPVAGRRWRRAFVSLRGISVTPVDGAIDGIEAPSEDRLVLRLVRPASQAVIAGLATPASVPIAADTVLGAAIDPVDAASGPYLADVPGQTAPIRRDVLRLRRSALWSRDSDVRPAYADVITLVARRGAPIDGLARGVLAGRRAMLLGSPPASVRRAAERRASGQVTLTPRPITRYVAFASTRGVLADRDVRRALVAATDRIALLRVSGAQAQLASHFLPPGTSGHDESGGADGTGLVTLREPAGDLRLAQGLLRSAGYVNGRLPSGSVVPAVRAPGAAAAAAARVLARSWRPLGLRLRVSVAPRLVAERACGRPTRRSVVCVSAVLRGVGDDGASVLAPLVAASNVAPITDAAAQAAAIAPGRLRDQAWAGINRALVDQAVGVPWRWDERALLVSRDVLAVVDPQTGLWDLPFTSLDARSR